ncbi:MAG: polysaccharide deacetylase family protein, partial [Acidobacteriia bacterium]|nr:polysaccharide deacetylase family protein [Terriglobia bacterium]
MKNRSKTAAAAAFHYGGGTWFIRRRFRDSIRILMYHRFPPGGCFESQCAHLRRHYSPISLTEAVRLLRERRPLPTGAVVVTVDDGYRDFLERAYPALQRYSIPATVFLTTDLPDRKTWLWVDQVVSMIRQTPVRELAMKIGGEEQWMLDTAEQRARAAASIKQWMKKIPNADRLEWMEKLPRALEMELPAEAPEAHAPLAWDDVRELARGGIEFGGHTRTHPILSRLATRAELVEEIRGSKLRIEAETGVEARHFCYPNGTRADFTEEVIQVVGESGFESAVTGLVGVNRGGENPFELKR